MFHNKGVIVLAGRWTDRELNILRSVYPNEGVKGVLRLLPYRTESGIKTKASELGLKN